MAYDNLRALPKGLSAAKRFSYSFAPEPMSGCWLWTGAERGSKGYGAIKVDGRPEAAHRFSFRLHKGSIPAGLLVLHHCDVPGCVNPAHLFLGSTQDNSDDKVAKGRQSKGRAHSEAKKKTAARGSANGNSRLTEEDVLCIRSLEGIRSQRWIAARYGVSQTTIHNIQKEKVWK